MDFPGSIQVGYLSEFIQSVDWWNYFPGDELLVSQPGDEVYNAFVSVVAREDKSGIMAYIPKKCSIDIRNPRHLEYEATWLNTQTGELHKGDSVLIGSKISIKQEREGDWVLKLDAK
jgi:hypothetical protein